MCVAPAHSKATNALRRDGFGVFLLTNLLLEIVRGFEHVGRGLGNGSSDLSKELQDFLGRRADVLLDVASPARLSADADRSMKVLDQLLDGWDREVFRRVVRRSERGLHLSAPLVCKTDRTGSAPY